MSKYLEKGKRACITVSNKVRQLITNNEGDQITGWLIVILLVVVVGAFFIETYQGTITEIWEKIVEKIYDTFGI